MRIALDATYSVDSHPSGVAIYSREIMHGLARRYPQDTFVHCYRPKQFKQAPGSESSPNVRRRVLLPYIARQPWMKADIFHALNQRVDHRPARKVISTFHDLFVMTGEYSSAEFRARFTEQAKRAAQNSDFIITVSEFTACQVHDLLGVERARIRVIPHGVHYPPSVPNQSARENLVLSVGAIQLRKNTARLVEAFEALPQDWRLVLAGAPSGFGAEQILKSIEQSACRSRIQVTGYLPITELETLYRRASIFAFPSLDEGFGIPVLEAMGFGVAVIASNSSALPEVSGNAAVLVNPKSTEEIGQALARLAADINERSRLADLGRARTRNFLWSRAVESTYELYRTLI